MCVMCVCVMTVECGVSFWWLSYGIAKAFLFSAACCSCRTILAPLFAAKAFSVYGYCDAKALAFCINVATLDGIMNFLTHILSLCGFAIDMSPA